MPAIVTASDPELIKKRLRAVPQSPGVYLMRDSGARVIYVGKALRLRDRLRSYFTVAQPQRTSELVRRIADFEFVVAANEVEALALECNLIKHYRPRFNIRLKDDKNFLYLKIPVVEEFPRVHYTRRIHDDRALYFGPYTSALSLRQTVKSIRQLLPFRTCSDDIFRQGKVCLDYHIRRCPGPCEGKVTVGEYRTAVQQVALLMEGRSEALARDLRERMAGAAEVLDFENAARYRDRLAALDRIADRQKVTTRGNDDQDLIAVAGGGARTYVEVAYIRGGRMVGHDGHPMEGTAEVPPGEVLRAFLMQYYASAAHIPRTVVLPAPVDEPDLLAEWLGKRRGGPVALEIPQRGRKRQLLQQLQSTADEKMRQLTIQWDSDRGRTEPQLQSLAEALEMSEPPRRIECYDISNTQGDSPVGAMVVFQDGVPRNEHYRHFKIKLVQGPNDFAMLQEVLRRRFSRLESALRREDSEEVSDRSFSTRPDLVIIDGGRGQLSAAVEVMEEMGFADIPTFSLAKREEEVFAPDRPEPVTLPRSSPGSLLLQRLRDETHRFAITHHRKVRGKKALTSPLDSVEGIGPARKRSLIRTFGSIQAIREASVEQLRTAGLPEKLAMRLKELL